MPPTDEEAEAFVARWIERLPRLLRRAIIWLRRPSLAWLRIAAGVVLVLASTLWFLPILGLWMLPLGLLLIAEDVPALRRRLVAALMRIECWWARRR